MAIIEKPLPRKQRIPAVERDVAPNGYAPRLEPGEFCLDTHQGLWHFCTPDNFHFAVDPAQYFKMSDSGLMHVWQGSEGASILPNPPTHMARGSGEKKRIEACHWNLAAGWWEWF